MSKSRDLATCGGGCGALGTGGTARLTFEDELRLGQLYTTTEIRALLEGRGRLVPGLVEYQFKRPREEAPEPYVTPDKPASCWKRPGPAAGPFQAHPGDGSVVTYYWYRFADQPALLNADLTVNDREDLQARVVKLHRNWTKDREYLAPPMLGKLAEIDPALIVTPPSGLEAGYVPIVTRQAAKE